MNIKVRGARENNLKSIDVDIGDGLTAVSGVSGSGKTSLVFETIYHEARRRFYDAFNSGRSYLPLTPADVDSVTGIGPTIAIGQNLLNRNPASTLASASGLHPFLRLLYAKYGIRRCPSCGATLSVVSEDEVVETAVRLSQAAPVTIVAPLVHGNVGSHRTLLQMLVSSFAIEDILVDGACWHSKRLNANRAHDISIIVGKYERCASLGDIRRSVATASELGSTSVRLLTDGRNLGFSWTNTCSSCGTWFEEVKPKHFDQNCHECEGHGCTVCKGTGLHALAAQVVWQDMHLNEVLGLSVERAHLLFSSVEAPSSAKRLLSEIRNRLQALMTVGLGYVQLNRPSPTLSRGEAQRVRIAVSLTNRLEDVVHIMDEPTVGQHPADVARLLPSFRKLPGPVIYVEHDRLAASVADAVLDLGPGAGEQGGEVVFLGSPLELWGADTASGQYFSLRKRVTMPTPRPDPKEFVTVRGATEHNLQHIDVSIPVGRLTVVCGISGSGKSTLVEDVLVPTLEKRRPMGCEGYEGRWLRVVLVDQKPIGKNPRSNPATYTKLSDLVRDLYARETGLAPSCFSFNRPEGACKTCNGMGAVEITMRSLPSMWVPCSDCEQKRFSEDVLNSRVKFAHRVLSVADVYDLSISEAKELLSNEQRLPASKRKAAGSVLDALVTVGLGYLRLGQPSPSLSGGEAQRVKLAKFLGRKSLSDKLIVLDEPTTGLHPSDLNGLLKVLDSLVEAGATLVVVEHNTDIIRSADWLIELGPGAGTDGGRVVYSGRPEGILKMKGSATGNALRIEERLRPHRKSGHARRRSPSIVITNAHANNLRDVDVTIPKSKLTVVTGVSGSGKSSLVKNVLEAEARRRFLESLSLYERQGLKEGPEAPVGSITGLGVTASVNPRAVVGGYLWDAYRVRSTVGTASEISQHLTVVLAGLGQRRCLDCGAKMTRGSDWLCPSCGARLPLDRPRDFSSRTYTSACETCHGIGFYQAPVPEKLIVHPERPLCGGAMHSPGFFPQGFLCQRYNGGYYIVQALAARYGFDPKTTPWAEMSKEAQDAFLFGCKEPLDVSYESKTHPDRKPGSRTVHFRGFYGGWAEDTERLESGAWGIGTWDLGGMFTKTVVCRHCAGSGFRPRYLAVDVGGHNIHELSSLTLSQLGEVLRKVEMQHRERTPAAESLRKIIKRIGFLEDVGLGYLHLKRIAGSLSAGEAQRVVLARLLGSGLTSLTVLVDEPTRGMHPCEVESLTMALKELAAEGNTVVVVEHDPLVIRQADVIIDMGPGAGAEGGRVVATGTPEEVAAQDTVTAKWLRRERRGAVAHPRRTPTSWIVIKGARENNLKGDDVKFPLGILVGVCGVSGSGKSSLVVDTLGRALAPKKVTTSVAYTPITPGEHDAIEGRPDKVVILDQAREGIRTPAHALDLLGPLRAIYMESEDAKELGIDVKALSRECSACEGNGRIKIDMGFLPDAYETCETCQGTGYKAEAWQVRVKGFALPELSAMTLDEIHGLFGDEDAIAGRLVPALQVGLGYLTLLQPSISLSGGEIQRLKIAKELSHGTRPGTLYILDEPTVGQSLEDVDRLIGVLHRLVADGHGVIVVEHHPMVLASCDWLIEMGPKGGPDGGRVIAAGTPEQLARMATPTAPYITHELEEAGNL